jgi:hypothetical protein
MPLGTTEFNAHLDKLMAHGSSDETGNVSGILKAAYSDIADEIAASISGDPLLTRVQGIAANHLYELGQHMASELK